MLTRSRLKEVFSRYGFSPLKRFGENYLIDGNIKDKIITRMQLAKSDVVLEIGPGLGALTIDLAERGVSIFAVEKDRKAFEILVDLVGDRFPNLKLFNEDILKFDLNGIFEILSNGRAGLNLPYCGQERRRIKVVGNLPYYITAPAIEYIIENRKLVKMALIMVQKEVAMRLLAKPGTDDYGSLSCFVQYYAEPEYVHIVKRTCFYPAPEVDSAIVKLDLLDSPSVKVKDEELFFKIIRGAFNQRRKSVINSLSREEVLKVSKDKLHAMLCLAGIDPRARPECLSLADFAKIANVA